MKRTSAQSLSGFARQEATEIKFFEISVKRKQDKGIAMGKIYRWYYVRYDAKERFERGERDGPGISAAWNWQGAKYRTKEERERSLESNRYKSYADAFDALVRFAE